MTYQIKRYENSEAYHFWKKLKNAKKEVKSLQKRHLLIARTQLFSVL
jgi:hypothetical protein